MLNRNIRALNVLLFNQQLNLIDLVQIVHSPAIATAPLKSSFSSGFLRTEIRVVMKVVSRWEKGTILSFSDSVLTSGKGLFCTYQPSLVLTSRHCSCSFGLGALGIHLDSHQCPFVYLHKLSHAGIKSTLSQCLCFRPCSDFSKGCNLNNVVFFCVPSATSVNG